MRRPSWKVARGRIEQLGRSVLPDVAGHGRYFCAVAHGRLYSGVGVGGRRPAFALAADSELESEMGAPVV
jgi:hypothetical protein